jgi:hypothetical protein
VTKDYQTTTTAASTSLPETIALSMTNLAAELERQEDQIVFGMRLHGASWTDIGAELGISKQAAHERFAKSAGLLDKLDTAAGRTPPP